MGAEIQRQLAECLRKEGYWSVSKIIYIIMIIETLFLGGRLLFIRVNPQTNLQRCNCDYRKEHMCYPFDNVNMSRVDRYWDMELGVEEGKTANNILIKHTKWLK